MTNKQTYIFRRTFNKYYHDSFAVSSEGIFQQLCQDRISVGDSGLLALAELGQCVNDVAQRGQTQVDGRALLQAVAGSPGGLDSFAEKGLRGLSH